MIFRMFEVIQALLKKEANPNVGSPAGTTSLMDICARLAALTPTLADGLCEGQKFRKRI